MSALPIRGIVCPCDHWHTPRLSFAVGIPAGQATEEWRAASLDERRAHREELERLVAVAPGMRDLVERLAEAEDDAHWPDGHCFFCDAAKGADAEHLPTCLVARAREAMALVRGGS